MNDKTQRATQIVPSTINAIYEALSAISKSGPDRWTQTQLSLTDALWASYNRWLKCESICEATQTAPSTTNAVYEALGVIRHSGLDRRMEISLTGALIETYHRWLSRQPIRRAGSEPAK